MLQQNNTIDANCIKLLRITQRHRPYLQGNASMSWNSNGLRCAETPHQNYRSVLVARQQQKHYSKAWSTQHLLLWVNLFHNSHVIFFFLQNQRAKCINVDTRRSPIADSIIIYTENVNRMLFNKSVNTRLSLCVGLMKVIYLCVSEIHCDRSSCGSLATWYSPGQLLGISSAEAGKWNTWSIWSKWELQYSADYSQWCTLDGRTPNKLIAININIHIPSDCSMNHINSLHIFHVFKKYLDPWLFDFTELQTLLWHFVDKYPRTDEGQIWKWRLEGELLWFSGFSLSFSVLYMFMCLQSRKAKNGP